MSLKEEEAWLKNLNMHNLHPTEKDKFIVRDVLEDARITTEILMKQIEDTNDVTNDFEELQKEIKKEFEMYQWTLEQERKQIEDRNADLDTAQNIEKIKTLVK